MSSASENPPPIDTAPAAPSIAFDLACVHCEASLSGTPLDGTCPTCSKPIADTLDPNAIDSDTMTVSADIPCPECDYNLRSLSIDGVCPECGQPFVLALSRRPLSSTDPAWRKRVLSGINRLLFFMIAAPPSVVAMGFTAIALAVVAKRPAIVVTLAVESVLFVILLAGIFGVSTRDSQATDPDTSAWHRLVARTAIILAGFLLVWVQAAAFLGAAFLPDAVRHATSNMAEFLLIVVSITIPIAVGLCLRQIARRARDNYLVKITNTWIRVFFVTASMGTLAPVLLPRSSWLGDFGRCVYFIVFIAAFILYFQTLLGLAEFRGLLRRADAPANRRHPPE